jgi:hypothetical protein
MTATVQNIKKSEIALIQLRRAIQLFNCMDFISSLTLAGAANEILGVIAKNKYGYNSLDNDKWFIDGIAEYYKVDKPNKEKVLKVNNRIKNILKHHNSADDDIVEADFKFEAQCHIDSAIRNYWIAFDVPPKDKIINNYVNYHWM